MARPVSKGSTTEAPSNILQRGTHAASSLLIGSPREFRCTQRLLHSLELELQIICRHPVE